MNERIKELILQSVTFRLDPDSECYEAQVCPEDLESLAELIVNECADILMKPEYAMNHPEELSQYNKGWVYGRLLGIEQIKEHFGVEE
jgi:hypothetical protein